MTRSAQQDPATAGGRGTPCPARVLPCPRWRALALAIVLACILMPHAGQALTCAPRPPATIALAARCTDGVCADTMVLDRELYRSNWCRHETRPVVREPDADWPSFPEIAARLGYDVHSGVYVIETWRPCLRDMARTDTDPSWTPPRAAECRLHSTIMRVSEDGGPEAFADLRAEWRATEQVALIAALPGIIIGSYGARLAIILATVPAVLAPWVLVYRGRRSPRRVAAILAISSAVDLPMILLGAASIRLSSDYFNGGDRGLTTLLVCMLILAVAIVIQLGLLVAASLYAAVKRRARRRSSAAG